MKKNKAYQQVNHWLLMLMLSLPSLIYADSKLTSKNTENILVLDLERTIQLALNNSDKLFDAQSGIRIAELIKEVNQSEFDLNIYPRGDTGYIGGGTAGSGVTVGGGVDFEKKLPIGTLITISPAMLRAADKYHSTFQARISQPLLRGFGREYNMAGIRMAEFAERTATRTFYKSMNHTVLRSIELLYDVAKQEELVKLNNETYQRLEKFWKATKIKERIGLSNGLDLYRAEMEMKQAEGSLHQSYEFLQDAKDLLRDILALPPEANFTVNVPLELSKEEWNLEEAINIALKQRIEIDQGLDQIDESRRLAKLSEKDLWPDINLVIDYSNLGYGEQFTGSFGSQRESRWGIGFTTSTDVDRVREKSFYERTLIGVEAAQKAFLEIKKSIALEVKRTLRTVYRAREKIDLQKQQIKSLEGGVELAKAKFLREFATSFEVIQAEKAFHMAQINLFGALIDHKVGEYRLRAVLGLLIEKNTVNLCK